MTELRLHDRPDGADKTAPPPPAIAHLRLLPSPAAKGGKGEGGPVPAIHVNNSDFVQAAFKGLKEGAVAVVCSKRGDPAQSGGWNAEPARAVDEQCPPSRNNYFNCSSFTPHADANVTARKTQFASYNVLMLDDVGSKVDWGRLGAFVPSWTLETSPRNFQVGIILAEPLVQIHEVEALQSAIVAAGLCDAGAVGISRWARLPIAINGKPKYAAEGAPFSCRLHSWKPEVAYTVEEIVDGLGLTLHPPLPSLPVPARKDRTTAPAGADGVFVPKALENPVVSGLREMGLYKFNRGAGVHDITCPWHDQHTDQLDSGAAYFEPSKSRKVGGFKCHHSHGDQYHIADLLKFLDLTATEARNRPRIRIVAGELNEIVHAAEQALAGRGNHYQSGGVIAAVRTDPHSRDVSIEVVSEQALTQALAEAADWEKLDARSDRWVRCDPPMRVVGMLHKAQSYSALPVLRGLARQPYFREEDGVLNMSPGYDPVSGKFASFDPGQFALGDTSLAGARAALGRLESLLKEFHFASEIDRSAALAAMLTAAVRATLPVAPAFSVTASGYGSGKTYLCKTIIPFAGAGDPMNVSYPNTSDEATKVILSTFMQSPAVLFFDDMTIDWKAHGVLNRMLTSETITDRILGVSKTATVGTRTLVLGSGNNIEPLKDLRRRVISICLSPRTATPAMLRYEGRPAEEVERNRASYVSAALTIVEAWRLAGRPRADVFEIASFNGLWSDYCRQPLLWLGLPDPASSLRDQVQSDPDSETLGDFLEAWIKQFGNAPVSVRKLVGDVSNVRGDDLLEAIKELPVTDLQGINKSKLGWYLKKQSHRIVRGLQVEPAVSSERRAWRVVSVRDELAVPVPSFAPFAPKGGEKTAGSHDAAPTPTVPADPQVSGLANFKWPPAGRP